ncbi:arginine--tRNA ligase, partial [bacterium]|nr:arginine--tRNA ligase [bacterium]
EKPKNPEHGDFSSNICFRMSRQLKTAPQAIAEELVKHFSNASIKLLAIGGFINFKIDNSLYQNEVKLILEKKEKYADMDILKNKKIQVEFISANPTGPLTLANGRGGFSGDVLANVFKKLGAKVEREYYVNDGGNQVKTLGKSILAVAGLFKEEDDLYKGPYIEEWSLDNKAMVRDLKDDPFALGVKAANDLLEDKIKPSVKNMNINFDNWFSEKEMIEKGEVDEAIEKLKKYKLTFEKDGALWMRTTDFGDDKDRVLVKTDGEKTYFANDVAYHFDKLYKRNFNKIIDIWGADHHGYVGRMKAAVDAMGCPDSLDVIITQMVRLIKDGKEFKISKRKGTYATVDEL